MCTIIVAVPKHRSTQDVAKVVKDLRPTVFDPTIHVGRGGYRPLEFSVAERGKEVHMTIHGVTGSDATTVWGQVNDDLYGRQLSCVLHVQAAKAA